MHRTTAIALLSANRLNEIVDRLVKILSPLAIYLFGAQVQGTPHEDSDVDILVLVDDAHLAEPDLNERGYRALRSMFLPIELHFCGAQRFADAASVVGSFEHEVMSKGRLLYADQR